MGETLAIASVTQPDFAAPASGSEITIGIPRESLLWLAR
jgi:hypothetical protein